MLKNIFLLVDDLYETYSKHQSSKLSEKAMRLWKYELENSLKKKTNPSLLRVLIKQFGPNSLLMGLSISVMNIVLFPCSAMLVGELVSCYTSKEESRNCDFSYFYVFGISVTSLIHSLIIQPTGLASNHMGLKIRVVCSCLIYEKILKLSKSTVNRLTHGHILSLLSTDVNVFEFSGLLHYIWVIPLQSVLFLYLMYYEIGTPSIFGIGFIIFFTPIYFLIGRVVEKYRLKVSARRDQRIGLTNELIKGISVIKMYGWEIPFANIVSRFREMEMNSIQKYMYLKVMNTFDAVITTISVSITILSSVLLNNVFEIRTVFVCIALLSSIAVTMTSILPHVLVSMAEMKIALKRIQNFLLSEEINVYPLPTQDENSVSIIKGYATWDKNIQDVFSNLNLQIKKGSLTAVIGKVGCGKSSLCQAIQGELPFYKGQLCVNGSISCASQEAWIFGGSIRQNILFGSEMDEMRYQSVLKCCALETDLQQLPYGDLTAVGDCGVFLSGGQRARLNLARSIYRKADIYILDDPLSAVDTRVGKHIFDNCIKTFLKESTVILVTHHFQHLKQMDYIIVLDSGYARMQGSVTDLEQSNCMFINYLNESGTRSTNEVDVLKDTSLKERNFEKPKEKMKSEYDSLLTYKSYLLASNNYLLIISAIFVFILTEVSTRGFFYFIKHW